MESLNLPEWMIYQSFRYCLGRKTYAVGNFVDWAIKNWDIIPELTQQLIIREIKEAFGQYERGQYHILGMDMDRQKWQQLLEETI